VGEANTGDAAVALGSVCSLASSTGALVPRAVEGIASAVRTGSGVRSTVALGVATTVDVTVGNEVEVAVGVAVRNGVAVGIGVNPSEPFV